MTKFYLDVEDAGNIFPAILGKSFATAQSMARQALAEMARDAACTEVAQVSISITITNAVHRILVIHTLKMADAEVS